MPMNNIITSELKALTQTTFQRLKEDMKVVTTNESKFLWVVSIRNGGAYFLTVGENVVWLDTAEINKGWKAA